VSLLLRTIRKPKWLRQSDKDWLPDNTLQADALGDLKTQQNSISLWKIHDDRSNMSRIIAALAASKDSLSNIDYAIFDYEIPAQLGIKLSSLPGETLDKEANIWHIDATELTAMKLLDLAQSIYLKAEINRFQKKEVTDMIIESISQGFINIKEIPEGSIRAAIETNL